MGRSSLIDHRFPPFYACYLLKSDATSRLTYVGSSPHPPRRLRQHNGEITQGATRTMRHRPWTMQMIVYGFPSRIAALQFEWAWQNPWLSRHLRDSPGGLVFQKGKRSMTYQVSVACVMTAAHPFNTWPLRVKFFTEQARKLWDATSKKVVLPSGLYVDVELEGVDGRSGIIGTGRTGPIDVTDEAFTTAHLRKAGKLSVSPRCTICKTQVDIAQEPLESALCPADSCTAVSHLTCLAEAFRGSASTPTTFIPRGGECPSCRTYTLWGDVIRGCYRRHAGTVAPEPEDEGVDDELNSAIEDEASDDALEDEEPVARGKKVAKPKSTPAKPRGRPKKVADTTIAVKKPKAKSYHTQATALSLDEHEFFDLDAVSSSTDSIGEMEFPWRANTRGTSQVVVIQPIARNTDVPMLPASSSHKDIRTAGRPADSNIWSLSDSDSGPSAAREILAPPLPSSSPQHPRQLGQRSPVYIEISD
ncbi:hypothetical protein BDW22DRAFT_200933 [Trametopsis cervina]|nr:hypothetical protein BDW22DRAFT_200933 [Trametopsis cervina]